MAASGRCKLQGFLDLVADAEDRIEGGTRFLKDIADQTAADVPQLGRAHLQDIAAFQQNLAACVNGGRTGQQPRDGEGGHALAGTALTHEAEGLARLQRERDAVHGAQGLGTAAKVNLQIANFEQGHNSIQPADLMRGSIQPYSKSTTQLAPTTSVALNSTVPMIIGGRD